VTCASVPLEHIYMGSFPTLVTWTNTFLLSIVCGIYVLIAGFNCVRLIVTIHRLNYRLYQLQNNQLIIICFILYIFIALYANFSHHLISTRLTDELLSWWTLAIHLIGCPPRLANLSRNLHFFTLAPDKPSQLRRLWRALTSCVTGPLLVSLS
jgi:hypothetical protein